MKRFSAVLFAAILVLCFATAAFAAEDNASVDASNFFVFTNEAHGRTEDTGFNTPLTFDTHVAEVCDPWAFVNLRTGNSYQTTETGFTWKQNVGNNYCSYAPGASNTGTSAAIAFELKFDTAGTFNPVITYVSAVSSPKVDLYLVDATKETKQWYAQIVDGIYKLNDSYFYSNCVENLAADDYLGTIDLYGDGSVDTATLPARTVKAQNYYLVIIPNGNNESIVKEEVISGETTSRYTTVEINSFAMAPRRTLTEANNTLEYKTAISSLDIANLPNFGGYNVSSYACPIGDGTSGETATTYGLRSTSMLHYAGFIGWKETHNYKRVYDENNNSVTTSVTVGDKTYKITHVEACEPYPTMLLSKTDPWKLESTDSKVISSAHSSSLGNYITGTVTTNNYSSTTNRPRITIRINVPYAGKYKLELKHGYSTKKETGAWAEVYFGKAPVKTLSGSLHRAYLSKYQKLGWLECNNTEHSSYTDFGVVDVPAAGEYIVSLYTNTESLENNPTKYDTGSYATKPYQELSLSNIKLTPVEDTELRDVQAAYDAAKAEQDALIPVPEEITLGNAKVNVIAADINGTQLDDAIIAVDSVAIGKEYTQTAPKKEGYTFLYWAKGIGKNRKIVSYDEQISFKAASGGTWLMAVYKDAESSEDSVAFYNANGERLNLTLDGNKLPSLPSMTGYDAATHWALPGDSKEYAPGEEITVSGEMTFVAQYDKAVNVNVEYTPSDVEISGGFVMTDADGEATTTEAFGNTVTVKARPRNAEGKVFAYWTKNGEVVSFSEEYSFVLTNEATLSAVYADYKPSLTDSFRSIILTNSGKNVFAEFIGLSDAIEKGILFGGTSYETAINKSPMTTDKNQFVIENDLDNTPAAMGYAILSDGSVIYSK